eukprot:COSAG01_NODE_8068_length_2934_cov_2.512703_1_plen_186_part_10
MISHTYAAHSASRSCPAWGRYWPIHADNGRRRLAAHSRSSSSATQGRRQLPEKGYYIPGAYSADLCATQWQWAFDDNDEYPQPQSFGHAGNPRPLSGHLDIEFEANKADVLAALAAHRVANISFDFGSSSAPPTVAPRRWPTGRCLGQRSLASARRSSVQLPVIAFLGYGITNGYWIGSTRYVFED